MNLLLQDNMIIYNQFYINLKENIVLTFECFDN